MVTRALAVLVVSTVLMHGAAFGQEVGTIVQDLDGKDAEVVARFGSAVVLRSFDSPKVPQSDEARGRDNDFERLPYQWYMVQDSSLGIVFRKRSGVKTMGENLDGDIDLEVLRQVRAIEIRAATFNVWREFTGTLSTTRIQAWQVGAKFSMNPHWSDFGRPVWKHYISIVFVARLMYDDGSIIETDLQPVLEIASRFSDVITKQDLIPETKTFDQT